MARSDDEASSESDSSKDEQNKRMPDDDYPADKFDCTRSEKSFDASHISDTPQFSDVCSEMESDITGIDRNHSCQSNENSETGSGCNIENFNAAVLRGQDPALSSPHRDLMKNLDFVECMKSRTRSFDSSKSDADIEKCSEDNRNWTARRSSGSISPRLACIKRRESIEGITQEELSHEQEINNVQKIDDHISGTHISSSISTPSTCTFKRAEFGSPGSPKRPNKFLTRPGIGTIDCPSPTRHHRRAESPLCSSRVKRRYASDSVDEPRHKRVYLDAIGMELRSHKLPHSRHITSAFTCQLDRTGSSVCGESCGSSEISTPSPPYEAQFLHKDHSHGISNLVRDFDHQSDCSTTTTPLHTPVNSRRGSHDSILSTDSRDHNTLLHSILEKQKMDHDQNNMDCDNL